MRSGFFIGQGYELTAPDGNTLDVSVFTGKFTTRVNMSLWQENNASALAFEERVHLNYDRFLPIKWAEKLAKRALNRHSMKVAGFNIIEEENK